MGGYYVCKLVGNGTKEDPRRPYLAKYPVNWVQVGQADRGSLCYVSNPTPEMEDDALVLVLPKNLDATFTRDEWSRLATKFMDYGLGPWNYAPERTVRETVIWIGTEFEPAFDIDQFSVL